MEVSSGPGPIEVLRDTIAGTVCCAARFTYLMRLALLIVAALLAAIPALTSTDRSYKSIWAALDWAALFQS